MSERVTTQELDTTVTFPDLVETTTFPNMDEVVYFPEISLSVTVPAFDWSTRLDGSVYALDAPDVNFFTGIPSQLESGSYILTGQDITAARSLIVESGIGSYSLTGSEISFGIGLSLSLDTGNYTLSGVDAGFYRSVVSGLDVGNYSISGNDLGFIRALSVSLASGAYAVTGTDASFDVGLRISLDSGTYAVTGADVALRRTLIEQIAAGSYALTGVDAALRKSLLLSANAGSYSITGTDITLIIGSSGIEFVASSNATDGASGVHTLPTGLLEDDLVIVMIANDQTPISGVPSGYTEIVSIAYGTYNRIAYKFMGPSPDTSLTWDASANIVSMVFRGVNKSNPIDVTPATSSGSGMPDPPSITTVTNGCAIVCYGGLDDDAVASSVSPPSGFGDLVTLDTEDNISTSMAAWVLQESAGTIDPSGFTSVGGSDQWSAATFALRPA